MTSGTRITRWQPDTCGCVIELEWDHDDNKPTTDPKFCLMNNICDNHIHLKSMAFRENHPQLSQHVLDIIEQAKTANLNQVDEQIVKAQQMTKGKARALRDLAKSREYIIQFNANLDEEWSELVSVPEAFDNHIHDTILEERKTKTKTNNGA